MVRILGRVAACLGCRDQALDFESEETQESERRIPTGEAQLCIFREAIRNSIRHAENIFCRQCAFVMPNDKATFALGLAAGRNGFAGLTHVIR